jgi:hypothetical protein
MLTSLMSKKAKKVVSIKLNLRIVNKTGCDDLDIAYFNQHSDLETWVLTY